MLYMFIIVFLACSIFHLSMPPVFKTVKPIFLPCHFISHIHAASLLRGFANHVYLSTTSLYSYLLMVTSPGSSPEFQLEQSPSYKFSNCTQLRKQIQF